MAGISFSGVSSGIDWDNLLGALMAVERRPLLRLNQKQDKLELQRDAFKDINSRLGNFKTEISSLLSTTSNLFTSKSATSSNTGVFTATAGNTALPGSYDLRVQQLAGASRVISATGATVGNFTSSYSGSDLNSDIHANTHRLGSLHRRDNSASFVDGDLGELAIDDGVTPVTVDLSAGGITSASTFQDMLNYINTQLALGGSAVTASLNASGDGISFGSGTGNISVANGIDGKATATKFGVVTGGLVAAPIDGGDLDADLQTDTPLSVLNGGAGIADLASGVLLRNGTTSVALNLSTATTVNDVITAINGAGASMTAAVSGNGKGFTITSTVANRSLAIDENGGTTGTDLGLFGEDNVLRIRTSGAASYNRIFLNGGYDGNDGNLSNNDIRDSINATTGLSFSSSVIDGRLTIRSNSVGTANALQFQDTDANAGVLEQLGILITDAVDNSTISNAYSGNSALGGHLEQARDATFSVDGLVVTRGQNSGITDVIDNVTLNLVGVSASTGPAFPADYASSTLTIAAADDSLVAQIEKFVNQYNSTIDFIGQKTKVDPEGADGELSGSSIARQLRDGLYNAMTKRLADNGQTYRSIFDLRTADGDFVFGSDSNGKSKITLDKAALEELLTENRQGVEDLFRMDLDSDGVYDAGLLVEMNTYVNSYNNSSTGVIKEQVDVIQLQIDGIDDEVLRVQERLASRETALKRQFSTAEQLLATLNQQSTHFASQMARFG